MNIEELRDYCLSKKGSSEGFPFDDKVLVFKVVNKMFALTNIDEGERVNLKCKPEKAIELREVHPEITPGYHMSKVHWNTVSIVGNLSNDFIKQLIDDSYNLVVSKLTKKEKTLLEK